jgi:transglutaminase-like putative cysteine protease
MDFSVFHETTYSYDDQVTESYTVAYLQPRTDPFQICSKFELETTPPSRIFHYQDRFGNDVSFFTILPPHRALTVASRAQVISLASAADRSAAGATRRDLAADPMVPMLYDFAHASPSVVLGQRLRALLAEIGEPDEALGDWYLQAGSYVNTHFTYDTKATSVFTDVDEAVSGRAGVCQDFAHVLIGLCRLAGIPARYVSGYIFSAEGVAVLGAEASHAWCEAYLPPYGWLGFDPTNNRLADDRFVKLAIGRDYRDVSPVRGIYKGTSSASMDVNVAVQRIASQQ